MNNLLKILLAIFLPGLRLYPGGLQPPFPINIVLTLLGGLPGMVHALWLVVSDKRA